MKKIDKKRYQVHAFESLLKVQIALVYPGQSIANQKIDQLAHLLENEPLQLSARSFFRITQALELDLTVVCNEFFKGLPPGCKLLAVH